MHKSYLHNYKVSKSEVIEKNYSYISLNKKKINVNINTLLNRVKMGEKNKKKEKLIFFSLGMLIVGLMGVFITLVK